jgi:hypothetical protein
LGDLARDQGAGGVAHCATGFTVGADFRDDVPVVTVFAFFYGAVSATSSADLFGADCCERLTDVLFAEASVDLANDGEPGVAFARCAEFITVAKITIRAGRAICFGKVA